MSFEEIIGRYCCAQGCAARREADYVMCRQHWWLVPLGIQRRVIKAMGRYANGPRSSGAKTELRLALASARRAVEEQEAKLAAACVAAVKDRRKGR